jgi:predicted amidohydrolase YtcJ
MKSMHSVFDKKYILKRIGIKRYEYAYAWKKVIDSNCVIVGSSDAPFGDLNPFHGINAFITNYEQNIEPDNIYTKNCISRIEALKSHTKWAAYGQFEENIKGSLKKGKLADFIIINKDIMSCPVDEIKNIKVLETYIAGKKVYNS